MTRIAWTTVAALLLLANPALGAAPKESGFFIGGGIGKAELDDDGAFSYGYDLDDSDTSFTLSAGYKFIPYFAVEARIGNLGTYSISDGFTQESVEVTSVTAHAVGIVPFGQSGWELYGQLGFGQIDFDCSGCEDETVGSAGLGIRFSPTRQFSVGVQVDAYAWEEDDYYDFSIATMQFVLQYLF